MLDFTIIPEFRWDEEIHGTTESIWIMTPLLDLQPLPLSAPYNKEFESTYSSTIRTFNEIQTQVFQADNNVYVNAPTGSGNTICAEVSLLRLWNTRDQHRAICIEPYQEMVHLHVAKWRAKFSNLQGGKQIWDVLWRQRRNVQTIGLLIADEIHLVGGEVVPTYEVVIS
ncbi:predicted protein, partial [Postia placenta Mad-698-R]